MRVYLDVCVRLVCCYWSCVWSWGLFIVRSRPFWEGCGMQEETLKSYVRM